MTGSSGCPQFCVDGAGTALKKLLVKDRIGPFNFCSNHALLPLSLFSPFQSMESVISGGSVQEAVFISSSQLPVV